MPSLSDDEKGRMLGQLNKLRLRLEVAQQDAAALGCLLGDVLEFVNVVSKRVECHLGGMPFDDYEVYTIFGQWHAILEQLFAKIDGHPALIRLEQEDHKDDGTDA